MTVQFDTSGPYEVEESDAIYARPDGLEPLAARIYRPIGAEGERLPCAVEVHGGAWSTGDRLNGTYYCRKIAACGIVVVAIDFRQGPAAQHPQASADIAAAIRWVRTHGEDLGVETDRIGMIGSSSGGHLALLVGIKPNSPEHTTTAIEGADATGVDASPAYVIALWPVSDPLFRYRMALGRKDEDPEMTKPFNARGLIRAHGAYWGTEEAMFEGAIQRIVAAGEYTQLPPVWVAQPELDQNVPVVMTKTLVGVYSRAGGPIEYVEFPDVPHAFAYRPGPQTEECIQGMRDFIGRQLAEVAERKAAE